MRQPKEAFPDTITPGLEGAGCFPLLLPYLVLAFIISLTALVIRLLDMSVSPSKLRCLRARSMCYSPFYPQSPAMNPTQADTQEMSADTKC